MSLPLSGQLGSAQLGAAELGQLASAGVVPPTPPPPVVIMSATSGLAFGDEEIERRPVVVAKPPKPVKAKRKKRKKRKPKEPATSPFAPSIEAAKPEVAPDLTIESLTEALAEFEKQRYVGVFNTAEYLRLISEVQEAERLRETIEEEDELLLLGCFYRDMLSACPLSQTAKLR